MPKQISELKQIFDATMLKNESLPRLGFMDRNGNVIDSSKIFPKQHVFNQTIYAPAGGIHSFK